MADPILALHKALLDALDSMTVDGVSVPVFDAVPQGQAFPYVTLDTHRSQEMNALVERRDTRFIFFNAWSEQRGQEQVLRILVEMSSRLDDASLSLDTGEAVYVAVDDKSTRRDADNVTFQGQMILRVMTHH